MAGLQSPAGCWLCVSVKLGGKCLVLFSGAIVEHFL
jgi:hypothetical protein